MGSFLLNPRPPSLLLFIIIDDIANGPTNVLYTQYMPDIAQTFILPHLHLVVESDSRITTFRRFHKRSKRSLDWIYLLNAIGFWPLCSHLMV